MVDFDREFAIQYISDNSKVVLGNRLDYQSITSMDNKELEFMMELVESLIVASPLLPEECNNY